MKRKLRKIPPSIKSEVFPEVNKSYSSTSLENVMSFLHQLVVSKQQMKCIVLFERSRPHCPKRYNLSHKSNLNFLIATLLKDFFFFFFAVPRHVVSQFPDQGWNLIPPVLEVWSPNHWTTRKVPTKRFFFKGEINYSYIFLIQL